ncbi:polyphosphate glucokinase [Salana multivorans]|uniref:Polyphosphate glucokinase n=1 Tax=Salana multivorans TaxID=120377 RepID=A0A3N2D1X1_9MICO|nr:ROK family protein [Salana multivorans]MBN8883648.1 ROK family protein [Salana multivorans]OJX93384.1 MAG: polyphosphate glucokinase [Micrococcales bacterium 73-15]ROR93751.1 polyphosphate glucokinase [Salana multivorans]
MAKKSNRDASTAPAVAFGIDIGGSGIKGAPVDLASGEFTQDRVRIETPQPSTPDAVAKVLTELVGRFDLPGKAPIGLTFPAIIKHGVAYSAANVDESWIGTNIADVAREATGHDAVVVNDADAAGFAEVAYGAARDVSGLVIVVTLGTGIGSAMIYDGVLVPNAELGHLEIDGHDAETQASSGVREREGWTYEEWAPRLQRYFSTVEFLFSPDLFVVGGGISKKADKFLPLLDLRTPIIPAALRNNAGIAGAAALAAAGAR